MNALIQTLKSYGLLTYGTVIPGLTIHNKPAPYPVLNERAIRAGAGIAFALGLFAFFQAFYLQEYFYIKILVLFLLIDFSAKVVVGTKFSPLSFIANRIVANQSPEYVGAVQKRFAWSIGLALAVLMTVLIFGFGIIGPINLIICGICLTFMFMESAFGICVGCKIYSALLSWDIIKEPEYRPACAGNVCAIE
jgi:hypothetical protein